MVLLWCVTQRVLISGFSMVEHDFALQSIFRVNATLNGIPENLKLKAIGWSKYNKLSIVSQKNGGPAFRITAPVTITFAQ
jgi:hypothetical protein